MVRILKKLKNIGMLLIVCGSVLSISYVSFGADIAPNLCRENISLAVEQFIHKEFSGKVQQFELKAFNEIRCEQTVKLVGATPTQRVQILKDYADMVNIVVTVTLPSGESYFSVTHIHFNTDGTFTLAFPEWALLSSPNLWKQEWCEFIFYVYPEELESFKEKGVCPKNFKPT